MKALIIEKKDLRHNITRIKEFINPENKEKLREIVRKIYKEKEKKANYKLDESNFDEYKELLKK